MERVKSFATKWVLGFLAVVLIVGSSGRVVARSTPMTDFLQDQDPLAFTSSQPVIIAWQIKADKGKDFEEAWAGIKALTGKSENAELKAFGESITQIYKVDMPPFKVADNEAVVYLFRIDAPSTTHSYNPVKIIYTYLGAGVEGSKLSRADGDAIYNKIQAGYLQINPLWKLIKVGG